MLWRIEELQIIFNSCQSILQTRTLTLNAQISTAKNVS